MSEPQQFGKEGVERNAGYVPMNSPVEPPAETEAPGRDDYHDIDVYSPISADEAAREVISRRAGNQGAAPEDTPVPQPEPIVRQYRQKAGYGDPTPKNQTVELDKAGRDLAGIRETERAAEQAAFDAELREVLNGQPQEAQEQQQAYQSTAEQPAQSTKWQDPEIITAFTEHDNRWVSAFQQRDAQYRADLNQNAKTSLAIAGTVFPELNSANTINDIPTIINSVATRDPQRARAMAEAAQHVVQTLQQAETANVQYQQRQAAQYKQQWDTFAKEQDSKFTNKYPNIPDSVRSGAVEYLRNVGFSDDDLSKSWNGEYSWSPRDARVQEIIRDASLYRQAQRSAKQKTFNEVPKVQRPGSAGTIASDSQIHLRNKNERLNQTGSWKDAAELLIARRSGRR